jgi:hypothetical protein
MVFSNLQGLYLHLIIHLTFSFYLLSCPISFFSIPPNQPTNSLISIITYPLFLHLFYLTKNQIIILISSINFIINSLISHQNHLFIISFPKNQKQLLSYFPNYPKPNSKPIKLLLTLIQLI